jgi:LPXTG-motif cell wall-anchored protein
VLVHFENTGNVLQHPKGSVTILRDGKTLQRLPFKMDTFLPQTAIDYPVLLKKALAPGEYETRVSLSFPTPEGGRKTIAASPALNVSDADVKQVFTSAAPTQQPAGGVVADSGSSTPWALIAGAAAALVLLLLAALLLLRRRRRGDDDGPPQLVLPPAPATPARAAEQPIEPVAPADPAEAAEPAEPAETAEPVATLAPVPAAEPVAPDAAATDSTPRPRSPACDPHHYWEVAYERGALGDDGVWRFPHRCQNCGLELLATDIADANAQAEHASVR